MILEKQYRVQLLDGREITTLYETRQEAVRAHRGNINKLIEVLPRHTKPKIVAPTNDQLAIVISARSDEDLNISKDCGYAVMYNCPKMDKIYDGMKYLEVSDEYVLEATITKLEKMEIDGFEVKYFSELKEQTTNLISNIDFELQELESKINLIFSIQGHRLNEVMKTLTILSVIFIPLTFLAGIYGMNFENMPELKFKYSYFILLAAMVIITLISVWYFKRKKWF